jgi:hypothetical protein
VAGGRRLRRSAEHAVLTVTASAEGIDHLLWMVNPDWRNRMMRDTSAPRGQKYPA